MQNVSTDPSQSKLHQEVEEKERLPLAFNQYVNVKSTLAKVVSTNFIPPSKSSEALLKQLKDRKSRLAALKIKE